jgi:lambda repressor-like predicted transcriptional regulator
MPASRRSFLTAGSGLLASVGVSALLPEAAQATPAAKPTPGAPAGQNPLNARADLALHRPVTASSTAYAPTPPSFAVDGLPQIGVRGSGWRAKPGDPQWITVDLQAPCRIDAVTLTFEATLADGPFDGNYGNTDGHEILSSAAIAYSLDVSTDNKIWQTVHETTTGQGGTQAITLVKPAHARWIRLTATKRSNTNPLGLNGFQVYGSAPARPGTKGWTSWEGGNTEPVPALTVAADGTVPLESGWALTMDDRAGTADGATLSTGARDVRDWLPATVPGTVLATLVEQGHLPDPVGGFENLKIPEALSRHSWWYRREFHLPRGLDTSPGRHLWLEYDGINHEATTWINGTEVGTVTHPFARGALDVTAALHGHTDHVIAVKVTPMPHPGTPGDKGADGATFVQGGHLWLDSPTYLAVSGWDWMPAVRDRVSGIWNHVRLRSTGSVVIGDANVTTELSGTRLAHLTVTVPVRNAANTPARVTIGAISDGIRLATTVTIPAATSTIVTFPAVTVRNPKLWWPNGYGAPDLHTMRVTATVDGEPSDQRTVRFGIRQFAYAWNQPIVISPPPIPPLAFTNDHATQTVTFERRHQRYVRIQAGARATGWGVSMWSLSISDGTGPDLAANTTVTASGDDGNPAANAVDGNPATRWSSRYQDGEWIQVDLGTATDFDRVTIVWEQAYALDYRVQVSADGATWADVKSVSNETPVGNTGTQVVAIPPQTSRYLRILGGKRVTDYGISMWALSISQGSGPDLARNKAATASGDDGNPAANAVDGNPRTRWSSRYQDGEWISVDLGEARRFDTVTIAWEQAYAREFVIQISPDGRNWTDVKAVDNKAVELTISVNGTPVFCRGGNWGWDELLRRTEPHRTRETVAMHRDMNFTMIRNWLGSSNREEFYAACDENGILVWNDFWEAGPFIDESPDYVAIAADTIRRYRHHPSIAVWCAANEQYPPAAIGAGLAKAVADESPDIIYVPSSNAGIVSGSGPWHWVDPATYADPDIYHAGVLGFHTEIGMPVVPVLETMRNLIGDQPEWPPGEVWNHHDWSPIGNQHTGGYQQAVDARLGASASLAEFTARAQFVNYENHRAMFEAWNAKLWQNASGLLLWMSHPAWYSTVWQTYDYDLDVNGAYYGARKSCEPVHVQADPGTWLVRAVNHTPAPLSGVVVTALRCGLDGRPIGPARSQRVSVGASATAPAFTVADVPGSALHLVRLELRNARGRLLSENIYWRYRRPEDMTVLTSMPRTRLSVRTQDTRGGLAATVTNRGSVVAALIRLALRDRRGERVLPARYDDNYFWLLPGESRRIAVGWPARLGRPRGLEVTAEAYNSR